MENRWSGNLCIRNTQTLRGNGRIGSTGLQSDLQVNVLVNGGLTGDGMKWRYVRSRKMKKKKTGKRDKPISDG